LVVAQFSSPEFSAKHLAYPARGALRDAKPNRLTPDDEYAERKFGRDEDTIVVVRRK